MTLNTDAERSGNTSRGSAANDMAPTRAAPSTSTNVTVGCAKAARVMISVIARRSVLMFRTFATGPLGFRLQQECTIDHHLFASRQPGHDFDFSPEVTATSDRTDLEDP